MRGGPPPTTLGYLTFNLPIQPSYRALLDPPPRKGEGALGPKEGPGHDALHGLRLKDPRNRLPGRRRIHFRTEPKRLEMAIIRIQGHGYDFENVLHNLLAKKK